MPASAKQQEISGHIDRVTFYSGETGFGVIQVRVKGQKDTVTVVGRMSEVHPGEYLTASGEWHTDPNHGRQLKAHTVRSSPPDSREGIEKFLGSGLIHGIGPVYAKKLVDRFGTKVLDVIENQSAKLEDVPGIGPGRRKKIKDSWNETRIVREIMTFLLSHGVSTARAFRIYKTYGEKAMQRVQSDPYCLARDIRGIGFKTADTIARHFGIDSHSPLRARAGVEHVLLELSSSGHCAYPREDLVRETSEQLDIPADLVEEAVLHGLGEKRLILQTRLCERPLIYLQSFFEAESQLALDLARLSEGTPPLADADPVKALSWVQKDIGMELAPRQQQTVTEALQQKVYVITGGPGVGKTTIVNAIIRLFRARKKRVRLAAPTGRAAKRLSETSGFTATTLHRLLVVDPANGGFKHNRSNPLKGDVFIIDEASMLDLNLSHKLFAALPAQAVVILVGDVDQLPSVGPGAVLKDVIHSDCFAVGKLTDIFRQAADSAIITNAHAINQGVYPTSCTQEAPGDFYHIAAETPEDVWGRIQGLLSGRLQKRFGLNPLRDVQLLTPMQRGALGARSLNDQTQALLNPRGDSVERYGTTFRVGDRVMQTLNNYDKDVFNGDMGHIVALDREEQMLWVDFAGTKVDYRFSELDELVLSYAITIHKSQGSEYPCVILPLHTQHFVMLQRNLLYTAVTRGKQLVLVIGPSKALRMALQRNDSQDRITLLSKRTQEAING